MESLADICMRLLCGYQDGANLSYPECAYTDVGDVEKLVRLLYYAIGRQEGSNEIAALEAYLLPVVQQLDIATEQMLHGRAVEIDTAVTAWGDVKPWS